MEREDRMGKMFDRMDRMERLFDRFVGALGLEFQEEDGSGAEDNESAVPSIIDSGEPKGAHTSPSIVCGDKSGKPVSSLSIDCGDENVAGCSGMSGTTAIVRSPPACPVITSEGKGERGARNGADATRNGAAELRRTASAAPDSDDAGSTTPLSPASLSPPAKTAPDNSSNRLQAIFSHPRDTLRERVVVGEYLHTLEVKGSNLPRIWMTPTYRAILTKNV